jgi:hypothetical protein
MCFAGYYLNYSGPQEKLSSTFVKVVWGIHCPAIGERSPKRPQSHRKQTYFYVFLLSLIEKFVPLVRVVLWETLCCLLTEVYCCI